MINLKRVGLLLIVLSLLAMFFYISLVKSQRDNAMINLDLANNKIDQLENYISKTKAQLRAIQKIDKDYQERLANAKADNDKLINDLDTANKRLLVKVKCPVMPTNSTATIKPYAGTAELTREARQDYIYFRLEINQITSQVKGLQVYVRNVCLK